MNSSDLELQSPASGLARLAAWCFDHRRRVVSIWVAGLVSVVAVSQIVGGNLSDSFSSASSPSGRAQMLLAGSFPAQAGDRAQVVVETRGPVSSAGNAQRIDRLVDAIARLPHVAGVVGPLGPNAGHQISATGPSPTRPCSSIGHPTSSPTPPSTG